MGLLETSFVSFFLIASPFGGDSDVHNKTSVELPVAESSIESFFVAPQVTSARQRYVFKAYADREETMLLVSVERPLFGEIVNIELKDIDNDGKREFIVVMRDVSSGQVVFKKDIFELSGTSGRMMENGRINGGRSFRQIINWGSGN